jgi:beta-lactamase class D
VISTGCNNTNDNESSQNLNNQTVNSNNTNTTNTDNLEINQSDNTKINNSNNEEINDSDTIKINDSDHAKINDSDSTSTAPQTTETTAKESIVLEDFSTYFENYDGCFVMLDRNNNQFTIYNEEKSKKRLSPCSTFKIMNSLITLETGVIEDETTIINWDGKEYPIETWNSDQTLQSAMTNSVVWVHRFLASKVGEKDMQEYLNLADYGNKDISGGLTKFWLQSSLTISPIEQIVILRKLYNEELPFSKRSMEIVKKILVLTDENGIKLSGKTGSGDNINGWFVGYVEKNDNLYYFATNIEAKKDVTSKVDGPTAKQITLEILSDKGIY